MKRIGFIRGAIVGLTTLGMLSPTVVRATTPQTQTTASLAPRDIALQAGGRLVGQVLDAQGAAVADTPVHLGQAGNVIASTRTDADGRFEFAGLRGGVHTVATSHDMAVYRLWSQHTAPPAANQTALLIDQQLTVRGNHHGHKGIVQTLANPWVLGGITAAAIAIPLALGDDDDPQPGS